MVPQMIPGSDAETDGFEGAEELRYIARQPILDVHGRVFGYELLFRSGPEAFFRGNGEMATRTMLDNSVIFGIEKLTTGLPAFVNCTTQTLTEDQVLVLPPRLAILEILEDVEPTPSVIEACVKLKKAGFRLALDDFLWKAELEPLLKLADFIKVDFTILDAAGRASLRKQLNGSTAVLVAEKVETQEDYQQACAEGFKLFQGYYFCRPILLSNRKLPANHASYMQILHLLQSETMDLRKLGQLVKRDASLAYRLLRLVNSPMYAVRHEVRSIDSALVMVGEKTFRRIATLAIVTELNANQPMEILRMALLRARFCELAAEFSGLNSEEQYLLGLFSLIPAMMQVPMYELAPTLPLREKIREVLLGSAGPESGLLHWTECYERGDWVKCDAIADFYGLNEESMLRCRGKAIAWAEAALSSVV
ncbi:MAG: HDOD domain-containing protein [Terracidiphilus sp.]|jgi:EAL and modified HD-GYP domain-containing signal transduction protein